MSTDWTTNKNKKFGTDELYLSLSNSLASIGIIENQTVSSIRNTFYNVYKRHSLCDGECSWTLFDRYTSSNDYTGKKFDNAIVLKAAIQANTSGQLYQLNDSLQSINSRKNLILNQINEQFLQNNLCNTITLTGFFPHLDVVDEISSIKQISGQIPCNELGYETFYAEITYKDTCHTTDDANKCQEPVPTFSQLKYVRNTQSDPDAQTASYQWQLLKNADDMIVEQNTGYNNKIFQVAMKGEGISTSSVVSLIYEQ